MATEVMTEVTAIGTESKPERESVITTDESKKRKFWSKKKDLSDKHSRRPPESKWLQQKIPACRPVFTAVSTFVGFIIIGVAFLIIGAVFTTISSTLRQFEVSYQDCGPAISDLDEVQEFSSCEAYLTNISSLSNLMRRPRPDCHCSINFTLPEDIRFSWNFYYGMRNYYQNHRRYLNSWDVDQLRGRDFTSPSSQCRPIINILNNESQAVPVVPCGLIANSWFNDSFDFFGSVNGETNVTLSRTNIAWNTDRSIRFQNPGKRPNISKSELANTVMPPNWPQDLSDINGGLQNESLMVWFRVSAFPWFRKLYGRPSVNGDQQGNLPKGEYTVSLTYSAFKGSKSIVLAEVKWLGGRNLFLGIAYLVVGAILIILAIGLLLLHMLCSKWKLVYASFNN